MVQDPNFVNPLINPILVPVIQRFILVFIMGFILILILNKFKLKEIWKSNLGKRYYSWLIIGTIYLLAVLFGGYPSLVFLLVIMILAIREFSKLSSISKLYTYTLYVIAVFSIYITSFQPQIFYSLPLIYFIILTTIAIKENNKSGLLPLSLSLFASILIIFALSHFVLLGHLNNDIDHTKSLLILVGFAVPLSDIGAYVIGKGTSKLGLAKYKIANKISPNKTYLGVLGDILGAALAIIIMYFIIGSYFSTLQLIFLAILIGVHSSIGDLTESLMKRYFNRKDSSRLIPGHGGILDRIDSTLRVIIIVYYFALFSI